MLGTDIWRNLDEGLHNNIPTLLLAPLASELNKKLEGLDQLLQKQAMFCKEIHFAMNTNVKDVDHQFTLQIEGEETQWSL